jgi:hypothetical protein
MIDFLKHHDACEEGVDWATNNCSSLIDCWNKAKPEWLIWLAMREGVLTDRELHEFSLWSAEQVRHLMTDPRSIAALDAKRKWLDGEISDDELQAACEAAWAAWYAADAEADVAARAAAWAAKSAARAAVWNAAKAAAWAAEWAADAAADAAAGNAAKAAVWAAPAAEDSAWVGARESQAAWLRENTKPNFGEVE